MSNVPCTRSEGLLICFMSSVTENKIHSLPSVSKRKTRTLNSGREARPRKHCSDRASSGRVVGDPEAIGASFRGISTYKLASAVLSKRRGWQADDRNLGNSETNGKSGACKTLSGALSRV